MRLTALLVGLCALNGCGGATSKGNDVMAGGASSGGSAGSGGTVDANGGATIARGGATSEPLGDPMNPKYPALPAGSGGFFWRMGLGNWFVSTPGNSFKEATFETDAGVAIWKAEGAAQQSLDLWVQLDHPLGRAVDLSAYSGVSFDAQLTGASAPLFLVFNASGKYEQAVTALAPQRFSASPDWQTFELRFSDIGATMSATTSFDFILTGPDAPFILKIRNLALLCDLGCP